MKTLDTAPKNLSQTSNRIAPDDSCDPKQNELELLGRQMSAAFGRAVAYQVRHMHQSLSEAEQSVLAPADDKNAQRIMSLPAERVHYMDMVKLQAKDPALAAQRWQSVRQRAKEFIRNGENQAHALSPSDEESVWQLAKFMAVRESLAEGCEPRNGIEAELLNQMAQYHLQIMYWTRILNERATRDVIVEIGIRKKLRPPEMSQAQMIAQAAEMVERFQRLFTRAHRAFQESRKRMPITVQNAGQINVAEQQVNFKE